MPACHPEHSGRVQIEKIMYKIYIIKSKVDNSFYIGYTNNLDRRLEEHNSGKTRYSSKKCPWELVYTEEFSEKTEQNMLHQSQFHKPFLSTCKFLFKISPVLSWSQGAVTA